MRPRETERASSIRQFSFSHSPNLRQAFCQFRVFRYGKTLHEDSPVAALDLTNYKLTFNDDFNNLSVSQTGAGTTWADIRPEWRFDANSDIGFGSSSFLDPASGYNPFKVENGVLSITAQPDHTPSGYPGGWESGLLTTAGNFSQTYGYFEIRANFSALPGAWDAFWLMPDHQVPDPNKMGRWQELDVVEHYGDNPKGVYSTIHTTDAAPNVNWQDHLQVYSETPQPGGFHTYGVDWEPDKITFYVDGQAMGSQPTPSDMHGPMYLLADLATQNAANSANVPITSYIDYIRAYASPNTVHGVDTGAGAPAVSDPGTTGQAGTAPETPPVVVTGKASDGGVSAATNADMGGQADAGSARDTPSSTDAHAADAADAAAGASTPVPADAEAGGHAGADAGHPPVMAAGDDPTNGPGAGAATGSGGTGGQITNGNVAAGGDPAVHLPTTVHHDAPSPSTDMNRAGAVLNDAAHRSDGELWNTPGNRDDLVAHLGMYRTDVNAVLNHLNGAPRATPHGSWGPDDSNAHGGTSTQFQDAPAPTNFWARLASEDHHFDHVAPGNSAGSAELRALVTAIQNVNGLSAGLDHSHGTPIARSGQDSHGGEVALTGNAGDHGRYCSDAMDSVHPHNDGGHGTIGSDVHTPGGDTAHLAHHLQFEHMWS
jgi:beta-glucanase (GH16 family)